MKRFTLLLTSLLIASLSYAVISPIPTYNEQVIGPSGFAEIASKIGNNTDERRDLNVESPPNPTENPISPAVVYAYKLDGTRTFGPFLLYPGGSLRIRIDGKPWGVSINSPSPMMVSVYITSPFADYMSIDKDQDPWGMKNLV